jgi:hypothetical protein
VRFDHKENTMKFRLALAALAVAVVTLPSLASAQSVVVEKRVFRDGGPRAEMRGHHDRGMHRGFRNHHRGDRVVVIKKERRHRY